MPKQRADVTCQLEKAKLAAIAAVEVYNRPGSHFRTAQFLVLMNLAWTALFHAVFYKRGQRPWYQKKKQGKTGSGKGIRYQRIDGEPKHWDISECMSRFYGGHTPPERKNLEYLVGLRNKVEHRHLPYLDPILAGECQASLLNFEDLLVAEFGAKHAMMDTLAVSLQFTRTIPERKAKALRALARAEAQDVFEYVRRFRSGLPQQTLNSTAYSLSVFLVPKVVSRDNAADFAMEFVPYDPNKPEEMSALRELTTLIKDKQVPVQNLELFRPSEVVRQVDARIPFWFNMNHHSRAWRHFKIRPDRVTATPEKTDARYCVFDKAHRDHVYTKAWIEKLCRELADRTAFEKITRCKPRVRAGAAPGSASPHTGVAPAQAPNPAAARSGSP